MAKVQGSWQEWLIPGRACGSVLTDRSMVSQESRPPSTHNTAEMNMALANPASRFRSAPAARGSAATAIRPAILAIALLAPEAAPTCSSSTAARTVDVRGATVTAIPRPNNSTPGSTPVR